MPVINRRLTLGQLTSAIIGLGVQPAAAQLAVFDPTNYAQNILQATRALEQVNNQILQLQHEAQMLQNMATNLKHLDITTILKLNKDLDAINQLMAQAKGIAFNLSQTQAGLKAQYPSGYTSSTTVLQLTSEAQTRWQSAMDAFQQTLLVQSQISESVQNDAGTLNELLSASDGAEGSFRLSRRPINFRRLPPNSKCRSLHSWPRNTAPKRSMRRAARKGRLRPKRPLPSSSAAAQPTRRNNLNREGADVRPQCYRPVSGYLYGLYR
ncbi:P-type conjugative transfer protein TrbJ [Asticcacaulis sp.]|uniref:P-type conjugative transfer protein TrbJ n=1 Tax=Asticcacaulis sp. TaxID=1872648 RepID=UPI003F7BB363